LIPSDVFNPDANPPTLQAVRANLAEATRVINGTGSDKDKMEARIEAQVYEALQVALK
jgi:F-type H+-transporting ATPase subunit delta